MFFFALAIALLFDPVMALTQEQVPVPSYKEGDSWQFRVVEKTNESSSSQKSLKIAKEENPMRTATMSNIFNFLFR